MIYIIKIYYVYKSLPLTQLALPHSLSSATNIKKAFNCSLTVSTLGWHMKAFINIIIIIY